MVNRDPAPEDDVVSDGHLRDRAGVRSRLQLLEH